jgi:phosphocarrier protein
VVSELVKITNPTGLHLRPAGNLCREAVRFKSKITFQYEGKNIANAKSVLSVLGSCVAMGDEILLMCEGEDEEDAISYLVDFIERGLDD